MQAFDAVDFLARVFLGGVGLVMLGHFVAMANFLKRAPRVVRFVLLPTLAGLGMYLLGCGIKGQVYPALYVAGACAVVLALYLMAWHEGAHVSETFEQRARERDMERMRYSLSGAMGGVEFVREGLADSGLQELQAAERRERRREAA